MICLIDFPFSQGIYWKLAPRSVSTIFSRKVLKLFINESTEVELVLAVNMSSLRALGVSEAIYFFSFCFFEYVDNANSTLFPRHLSKDGNYSRKNIFPLPNDSWVFLMLCLKCLHFFMHIVALTRVSMVCTASGIFIKIRYQVTRLSGVFHREFSAWKKCQEVWIHKAFEK